MQMTDRVSYQFDNDGWRHANDSALINIMIFHVTSDTRSDLCGTM